MVKTLTYNLSNQITKNGQNDQIFEIKFIKPNKNEIKFGQPPKNHKRSEASFFVFLELRKLGNKIKL